MHDRSLQRRRGEGGTIGPIICGTIKQKYAVETRPVHHSSKCLSVSISQCVLCASKQILGSSFSLSLSLSLNVSLLNLKSNRKFEITSRARTYLSQRLSSSVGSSFSLTVLRVWFHIRNHLKRGRVPMYLDTPLLEIPYEYRILILSEALHKYAH